ncbi:MAG: IS3 family transposase [Thermoguttaceae bacterium]
MSKKRKTYSPSFRAKVALAAHRGDKTIHELAAQFQVSPQQISNWKSRLLERIEEIFQDNRSRKKDEPTNEAELFEQIGRLKMEVDWLKKKLHSSEIDRRSWIDKRHPYFSVRKQCRMLEVNRSTYYFEPQNDTETNLKLMREIDEIYTEHPFYGCRKFAAFLGIDKDHANRLMRKMGIETIYQKPRITVPNADHEIYPYLLRDVKIARPDHVWSTDITYVPMMKGFVYLVAVIDWFSRFVLSWKLSNTLDRSFCLASLKEALSDGVKPMIFNTDQGSQFTSSEFTGILKENGISISMDGRGRALDNVFIERLWRSVKYEEIYLRSYETVWELEQSLDRYFRFYNEERPHQSLGYRFPAAVYAEHN